MTATVDVSVECDRWLGVGDDIEALVEAAALAALAAKPMPGAPLVLDVILTDDAEQQQLNRQYRGKDMATNVLSFPAFDPHTPVPEGAPVLLGDVVLAIETVEREARDQTKPVADHLRHLVVHGVLHLLGFDHEDDFDAAAMEALEVEILAGLGVSDPYRTPM